MIQILFIKRVLLALW